MEPARTPPTREDHPRAAADPDKAYYAERAPYFRAEIVIAAIVSWLRTDLQDTPEAVPGRGGHLGDVGQVPGELRPSPRRGEVLFGFPAHELVNHWSITAEEERHRPEAREPLDTGDRLRDVVAK